ncbi:PREDICTED: protein NRT1/ PTR FAMILY 5.2-like [Nelumbo nucifera]|uniref:Protein NRT1/ PTR FAMILY 5.2-like n=2 Tax=Nelumbo nucifera TaxID=4432 RepID=A0A822XM29_NELNU|nr:PREDICTED: protein NRT1/ PTR FAMILY 5.2-like [Nelumbo nucifera]DAD20006.1 TPA_asm: hypothetical protein HUJ06_021469 [Nelumbo nucifera]
MSGEEGRGDEYTQDGTTDLKGNPILRSERGRWKACSFIIVYDVFERMAFYGISSNLVIYMTRELHKGTVASSNSVTNWVGTTWLIPILGAYVADAHLGRYWTFLISSAIYLLGMGLLTLAVSLSSLKPPPCNQIDVTNCKKASTSQMAVVFLALYVLAVGTGGTKPNISTIGADQFDDFDPKEKALKLSFFNWWIFGIYLGTLIGSTFLVYVQDNVGWALGYGIPTIGLAVSMIIFMVGTPSYRHRAPTGSPFTRMARVIVFALWKWRVSIPSDPSQLYELDHKEYEAKGKFRIEHTASLRFFDKAAVQTSSDSPWKLCPVTQVEETKQMLRMIPIMVTTFVPSIMFAQSITLFVQQGVTLDRHLGNFRIPPASLNGFITISMLISIVIYDQVFVKVIRKWTKNPRGVTLLQRMGVGLALYVVVMLAAFLTERRRLRVARDHGLVENGGVLPLSILTLLPQFVLMGVADAFLAIATTEFFYDQAPENMKSLGSSYTMTSLGVGNFLSTFVLTTVSHATKKNGHRGWILNNLNASHLDYYYAFFTVFNFLNFILFLVVSRFYVYRAEVSDSMQVLEKKLRMSSRKATVTNREELGR